MATVRKLLSLLGKPVTCAALRGLIATDQLRVSREEDLHEGVPVVQNFIGKKSGYEILAEGGRVNTVFLHVEKADGFAAFPDALPYRISRNASRTEVRQLLGEPEKSGKAFKDKILGPQRALDRFVVDSTYVHIEYTDVEFQVSLITLMTEDAAP